jgi:hypothetical protein
MQVKTMSISTTTYHQIKKIEFDFQRDNSDPHYSCLSLRIYSHNSSQADKISFFPHDSESADHLHNIFLCLNLLLDAVDLQEVRRTSRLTSETGT